MGTALAFALSRAPGTDTGSAAVDVAAAAAPVPAPVCRLLMFAPLPPTLAVLMAMSHLSLIHI